MNRPPRYFYTGRPGVGKSTIVLKILELAKNKGCSVYGFIAPEMRVSGKRVGFKIIDVESGESGWLAKKGFHGPRIGKYGIVLHDAIRIGVNALKKALENDGIVIIDEIGPMELLINEIRNLIIEILRSNKSVIGVVHRGLPHRDPEVYNLVKSTSTIIHVEEQNRNRLLGDASIVAEKLCSWSSYQGRKDPPKDS